MTDQNNSATRRSLLIGAAAGGLAAATSAHAAPQHLEGRVGPGVQQGRMVAIAGDAELDEGNIYEALLEGWKQSNAFARSIENRHAAEEFVFYDGPPFANGLPHYGHLLTGFVKDAFARYQTMLGKRVERRFGWDCHGLPAEMGSEKELGISGRAAIQNFGIDKFNEH